MSAPVGTNQFTADEYVLAYHGPLLYEARVSQASMHSCQAAQSTRAIASSFVSANFGPNLEGILMMSDPLG